MTVGAPTSKHRFTAVLERSGGVLTRQSFRSFIGALYHVDQSFETDADVSGATIWRTRPPEGLVRIFAKKNGRVVEMDALGH